MFWGVKFSGEILAACAKCHVETSACRQEEEEGVGKLGRLRGGLGAIREEEAGRPGSGRQTEIDSN